MLSSASLFSFNRVKVSNSYFAVWKSSFHSKMSKRKSEGENRWTLKRHAKRFAENELNDMLKTQSEAQTESSNVHDEVEDLDPILPSVSATEAVSFNKSCENEHDY